jgi:hypothetical protein
VAAISLFQLENSSLPASLEGLVPAYLEVIPLNYLSADQRFSYQRVGESYKLETRPQEDGDFRPDEVQHFPAVMGR